MASSKLLPDPSVLFGKTVMVMGMSAPERK